jgi:hypothetical protein
VYAGWCGVEMVMIAMGRRKLRAFAALWRVLRLR